MKSTECRLGNVLSTIDDPEKTVQCSPLSQDLYIWCTANMQMMKT